MSDRKPPTKRSWVLDVPGYIEKILSVVASASVIFGIGFAIHQFDHTKSNEKVQNAINAVNQTRSSDFLKAYARLKTAYELKKIEDKLALIDDLNYVMNSYDNLALLYINDVVNKCLVKGATYSALKEIPPISDALSYPREHRKNLDRLLELMEKEVCD